MSSQDILLMTAALLVLKGNPPQFSSTFNSFITFNNPCHLVGSALNLKVSSGGILELLSDKHSR